MPRMNDSTALRFDSLNLPEALQKGVDAAGFEFCTPIQEQTLPLALNGTEVSSVEAMEKDLKAIERYYGDKGFIESSILDVNKEVVFDTDENLNKITDFAKNADLLFCEAAFLDRDRDKARERGHLTAKQAGAAARKAGVKELRVFHFSPRYESCPDLLYKEAEKEFKNRH